MGWQCPLRTVSSPTGNSQLWRSCQSIFTLLAALANGHTLIDDIDQISESKLFYVIKPTSGLALAAIHFAETAG